MAIVKTQPCENRMRSDEIKSARCVYQHETTELVEM
jgi:hypothetical protein